MLNFPRGIIVSIQPHGALDTAFSISAIAQDCAKHAVALRIQGVNNIREVVKSVKIPVIGLIKHKVDDLNVLITPTVEDASAVIEAGAEYVAMECTDRADCEAIRSCVMLGIKVIADVGDFIHASKAQEMGASAITTALSGYLFNHRADPFDPPSLSLVGICTAMFDIPVIAEGRYWNEEDIVECRGLGAHSVCIGTAISDPEMLTLRAKLWFGQ